MCDVVGHMRTVPGHTRKLLRNVFTDPVGDLGQCKEGDQAYPYRADPCLVLEVSDESASAGTPLFEKKGTWMPASLVFSLMIALV